MKALDKALDMVRHYPEAKLTVIYVYSVAAVAVADAVVAVPVSIQREQFLEAQEQLKEVEARLARSRTPVRRFWKAVRGKQSSVRQPASMRLDHRGQPRVRRDPRIRHGQREPLRAAAYGSAAARHQIKPDRPDTIRPAHQRRPASTMLSGTGSRVVCVLRVVRVCGLYWNFQHRYGSVIL